ncbi:MAG: hypothetical protein ACFFEY_18340 [Candidatus Thorarchaeota archaeon]
MNLKNWPKKAYILAIITSIQFLIFTNLSMLFYPGGTFSDPNTVGYSIFLNLFSDLGRFIAHSGESNLISFIMYNISLFLMGTLLIPYFIMFPHLFTKEEGKGYCTAGSVIGIGVSVSMMGASLTPADLFYVTHVSFGFFKFVTLLPLAILYALAILQNRSYSKSYAMVYIIFGIIQFLFLLIMTFGVGQQKISIIFAAGQNIVVNAMAICFLIQAYGAWKMQKNLIISI